MYVTKNILDKKKTYIVRSTAIHELKPWKIVTYLKKKKEKEIIDICLEFEIKNLLKSYDFQKEKEIHFVQNYPLKFAPN